MGSTKANVLRELYSDVYPVFGNDLDGITATAVNALALQIATWEVVNETSGTYDPTTGSIRFVRFHYLKRNWELTFTCYWKSWESSYP